MILWISKSRIGNFVPGKVDNGGYVSYQRGGPLNEGGRNILGVVGTIEDKQNDWVVNYINK